MQYMTAIDPEFTPLIPVVGKQFDDLWALPFDEFRKAWLTTPPALPKGTPTGFINKTLKIPVDEEKSETELLTYYPNAVKGHIPLFYVMHGGGKKYRSQLPTDGKGWTVGSHSIEEAMNRLVCVRCNAVVVSVNYRL